MTEFLVQINYKSGTSMTIWCEKFDIKHLNGKLTNLTYVTVDHGVRPIFLGALENIESAYQIDDRQSS